MKSRTVIILWIIAIVLGISASAVKFGNSGDNTTRTKLSPGDKLVPNLPIRDITKVTLSKGNDTTSLIRTNDRQWGVAERENYPVNYELLRNLLGALNELEVTQGYPSSDSHYGRFGLSSDTDENGDNSEQALLVTITANDQSTIEKIFLGKYSGSSHSGGRFIRIGSDDSGAYAVGETFPGVTASPKDWINKDFLKIDQIKTISLSAPADPTFKPWKLVRQPKTNASPDPNGQFKLAGMTNNEVMQLTSTNPLLNLFSYSTLQDVLSEQEAADTANPDKTLKRQVVITTHDGFSYHLEFWPQQEKPKDPNADDRLPPVPPSYLITVKVNADIPEKRSPEKNQATEKPEVAASRDAQFEQTKKSLQEKLAVAKALTGRIFQVSQSTVSPLLKKRSDFVKTKNKPAAGIPRVHTPATGPDPRLPTLQAQP